MKKSALQTARASYQPKLPEAIKNGVTIVEGKATQSVADQEAIAKLFPNTYGMPVLRFEAAAKKEYPAINVGVILSCCQVPGGHNVIFIFLSDLQISYFFFKEPNTEILKSYRTKRSINITPRFTPRHTRKISRKRNLR